MNVAINQHNKYLKARKNLPDVPWKNLIAEFKALRKSKNLTRSAIEAKAKLTQDHVKRWETGKNVTIKTLWAMFEAIDNPITLEQMDVENLYVAKLRMEIRELKEKLNLLETINKNKTQDR